MILTQASSRQLAAGSPNSDDGQLAASRKPLAIIIRNIYLAC